MVVKETVLEVTGAAAARVNTALFSTWQGPPVDGM